jgi:hypothetical protein
MTCEVFLVAESAIGSRDALCPLKLRVLSVHQRQPLDSREELEFLVEGARTKWGPIREVLSEMDSWR